MRDSLFDVALSFTGTPPQTPSTGSGALPAQGPVTSDPTVFSNVLVDTRTISSVFGAGDTMILDALVTSGTGPLSQSATFTLGAGVDSFDALAAWAVSTAAGPGPRLVGVNIDLFDSTHTLIASDGAVTVVDGVARSTFAGPLGPGTYTLVATGTGLRDSSLDMAVSFGGAAIPEPATLALLGVGLAGFAMARRRKPA